MWPHHSFKNRPLHLWYIQSQAEFEFINYRQASQYTRKGILEGFIIDVGEYNQVKHLQHFSFQNGPKGYFGPFWYLASQADLVSKNLILFGIICSNLVKPLSNVRRWRIDIGIGYKNPQLVVVIIVRFSFELDELSLDKLNWKNSD